MSSAENSNLDHLTDKELVRNLLARSDLTPLEMKLAERLDRALDTIEEQDEELDGIKHGKHTRR